MTVNDAIAAAERILPGVAVDEGADPRWQAIISVGNFIETNPKEVWAFAAKWGCTDDRDLRAAIGTCLVEHLLEYHFDLMFPKVEELAVRNRQFADLFLVCWNFGQSEHPGNAERVKRLRLQCGADS